MMRSETPAQRRLGAWARGVIPPEGMGDLTVGPNLRPRRAVVVESYDAWAHVEEMARVVCAVLGAVGIDVYRLPHQDLPHLVISHEDWAGGWAALMKAEELKTLWWTDGRGQGKPVSGLGEVPATQSCTLFQLLVSQSGTPVADQRMHVLLEGWNRVSRPDIPRSDGGTHRVGTLLSPGAYNSFASYLTPEVLGRIHARDGLEPDWAPTVDDVEGPVDIVYTWVDGSDPAWLDRRAQYLGERSQTSDAIIAARYENRDELRYSLRSLEMYAGWYNRIFLVTDSQLPEWLNSSHPKLTVVDHAELFTDGERPVFNSHAIESRLHWIKGLSEQFLYLNDDVLFGRPVRPELFFSGSGLPKYFPSKATIDPDGSNALDVSVTSAAKNGRELVERAVGRTFTCKLKHTPHAHKKSILVEMEARFPEVFAANVAARFRSQGDHPILSSLAQRYGAATGRALEGSIRYNYVDVTVPDLRDKLSRWVLAREYDTFCLNDTGLRTVEASEVNRNVTELLSRYYPLPSSFEVT